MPAEQPKISINICTYNRAAWLALALESLGKQVTDGTFSYEIVVIDDASTDQTARVIEEFALSAAVPVRYVLGAGQGIAHTRSLGLQASSGDWLAFFDDDQIAAPDWLKELFSLASAKGVFCVGGRRLLTFPDGPPPPLSPITRAVLGELDISPEPMKCNRKFFPGTGTALVKRSVFEAVGNFDPALVRGGEDLDFFRRIRMAGIEAWYTPKAVAYHMTPAYRLQPEYLHLTSLRIGENFTARDWREWGLGKTLRSCLARVGQAVLINLPALAWAWLNNDAAEVLGRQCLLWRLAGYGRGTLFLLAPRVFPQTSFFEKLEFRRERKKFAQT